MFTGIIEETGVVQRVKKSSPQSIEMTLKTKSICEDLAIGDSISVNGVCLTVTNYSSNSFSVDIMPETVKVTSLATLGDKSIVNLERAMKLSDRFGGHIVSGHVDTIGTIVKRDENENAVDIYIRFPDEFELYFIEKGSVAIDGISLTVFKVVDDTIQLSIIPHTAKVTTLDKKIVGDVVNIECDMLLKHVHHLVGESINLKSKGEKYGRDI